MVSVRFPNDGLTPQFKHQHYIMYKQYSSLSHTHTQTSCKTHKGANPHLDQQPACRRVAWGGGTVRRNRNPKPGTEAWVAGPRHLSCSPGEGFTAESQRGGNLTGGDLANTSESQGHLLQSQHIRKSFPGGVPRRGSHPRSPLPHPTRQCQPRAEPASFQCLLWMNIA